MDGGNTPVETVEEVEISTPHTPGEGATAMVCDPMEDKVCDSCQ